MAPYFSHHKQFVAWIILPFACGFAGCSAGSPVDTTETSTATVTGAVSANQDSELQDLDAPKSTRAILRKSAAVVQAQVRHIEFTYNEEAGPRTVVTLDVQAVHHGVLPQKELKLTSYGGPTPNGRYHSTSESVDFVEGETYLLGLRNDAWWWQPFSLALKVDVAGDRPFLVTPSGHAVTGLHPDGVAHSRVRRGRGGGVRNVSSGDSDASLDGALTPPQFLEVLSEAIQAEGVAPKGKFRAEVRKRDLPWNVRETVSADGKTVLPPKPGTSGSPVKVTGVLPEPKL